MRRGHFILLSGLGLTAMALPTLTSCAVEYNPKVAAPELLSTIWDTTTINAMGQSYRQQFIDENSERSLVKLLNIKASDEESRILEKLTQQIEEDFKNGDTVALDGWILSRTEARQCALYSLTKVS
ncbi:hypothetical protein [Aegicerativicinus sediminis]|uniref:hypothetical protein n=1 Tax=Aegicerativicinus sediminis TaxID=2893202 RepID=UPI001E299C73|nr:hypothetical protein [Aegicerativicinus sediminis]